MERDVEDMIARRKEVFDALDELAIISALKGNLQLSSEEVGKRVTLIRKFIIFLTSTSEMYVEPITA